MDCTDDAPHRPDPPTHYIIAASCGDEFGKGRGYAYARQRTLSLHSFYSFHYIIATHLGDDLLKYCDHLWIEVASGLFADIS